MCSLTQCILELGNELQTGRRPKAAKNTGGLRSPEGCGHLGPAQSQVKPKGRKRVSGGDAAPSSCKTTSLVGGRANYIMNNTVQRKVNAMET